jgi:Flp pilus assembly protein TadD
VIDEALLKFPKDPNILVDKINVYLNDAKYTEALTYINNLLDVEPNNDGALFIKGLAYEKIGNEDSVVYYYTRSAEVNSKSVKPYNNLGALYVNKANSLVEQMNKLGSSKADTEKYDVLAKQRKELYKKAKPYLTKAKELDPEDASIARALKQVELYTAE